MKLRNIDANDAEREKAREKLQTAMRELDLKAASLLGIRTEEKLETLNSKP
jgi:anaerobic glycerol-3-phosphate dehydrogenase